MLKTYIYMLKLEHHKFFNNGVKSGLKNNNILNVIKNRNFPKMLISFRSKMQSKDMSSNNILNAFTFPCTARECKCLILVTVNMYLFR